MATPDPPRLIRQLYRDADGYTLSRADAERVTATRSSPTYGEIMPAATGHLLEYLRLTRRDRFYDLGSGLGKVVLHAAMSGPIAKCVGLELADSRHRIAQQKLRHVRALGLIRAQRCSFRRADFMRAQLGDATVIYTCSTAFSTTLMNALAARLATLTPGLRWVSTQELEDHPRFDLIDTLRLDMSWQRRSEVFVYRLGTG